MRFQKPCGRQMALAGMAYTVGRFDIGVLGNLATLMAVFYTTCLLFIVVVLGSIFAGVATPLLIVLGTALSGAAGVFYLAAGTISFTWLSVVAWRLVAELPPRSASRR
jgi:TRAP-type mannitol/chloroaromatic compound transport system permease large subunit